MKFDYAITKDASVPPIVGLDVAKMNSHIEVDDVEQDDLLQLKLNGAIAAVEMYTGKVYQAKKVKVRVSEFAAKVEFPYTPIKSISEVYYHNAEGQKVVILPENYKLYTYQNGAVQRLVFSLQNFPVTDPNDEYPLVIEGQFGELEVPDDVVSAVLLLFSDAETYRENKPQNMVNTAAINLLRPHKCY